MNVPGTQGPNLADKAEIEASTSYMWGLNISCSSHCEVLQVNGLSKITKEVRRPLGNDRGALTRCAFNTYIYCPAIMVL